MATKQNLPHKDKGFRLSEARKILGYTQEELADVSEISLGSISAYERGLNLPKFAAIQKLRKVGISMEYVLYGTGEPLLDKQSTIPIQQSRSPALHIEETTASYDLGLSKEKPQSSTPPGGQEKPLSPDDHKAIAAYYSKIIDDACSKETIYLPMWLSFKLVELLSNRSISEQQVKSLIELFVSQREDYKYLLNAQFTEELNNMRNELAQKEVEAAKMQARAEIAEAKRQLLQSQMDDLKNTLKRTEHELAETEEALKQLRADITSIKKNRQQAA